MTFPISNNYEFGAHHFLIGVSDDRSVIFRDYRDHAIPSHLELCDPVQPGQRSANHFFKSGIDLTVRDLAGKSEIVRDLDLFPAFGHIVIGIPERFLVLLHLRKKLRDLNNSPVNLRIDAFLMGAFKYRIRCIKNSDR